MEGEWSASRPDSFTPGDRTPDTNWTGNWVGPRAGPDAMVKRKILCPCRESNPGRPARSLVTVLTELRRLPCAGVCVLEVNELSTQLTDWLVD